MAAAIGFTTEYSHDDAPQSVDEALRRDALTEHGSTEPGECYAWAEPEQLGAKSPALACLSEVRYVFVTFYS